MKGYGEPMALKPGQKKLLDRAAEIRALNPLERDELGFSTRVLVQCSLPHRDPGDDKPEWIRSNGNLSMTITPVRYMKDGQRVSSGFPYGNIPRLLLLYVCTQAIQTKQREISLSDSLSSFMRSIDLEVTGGRWGTITRFKDQFERLFRANIDFTYDDDQTIIGKKAHIADTMQLWWHATNPQQQALFKSSITLTEEFFNEVIQHPIPMDMGIITAIKQSPLALDLYTWLTHRVSYLKKPTPISWRMLAEQLGAEYKNPDELARYTKEALRKIYALWPTLKLEEIKGGIRLSPSSRPSVALPPKTLT
jgi:hypothetical protein